MCWCLDHADCAIEVARCLVEGLLEESLPLDERVLRLCLVSDVLHNSGSSVASAAWVFKREFEAQMPEAGFAWCLP
ncbi:unnamed protein product [Polarella glacialis]|uniref:CID domain-containing protein n=2 Tax=Polarella glacialis TaxID=89957 RepID=A0A813G7U8_POLGL|nr:unnamed protein product [Polarella glacialis]